VFCNFFIFFLNDEIEKKIDKNNEIENKSIKKMDKKITQVNILNSQHEL
jgi:hypothetical protein